MARSGELVKQIEVVLCDGRKSPSTIRFEFADLTRLGLGLNSYRGKEDVFFNISYSPLVPQSHL